MKTSPSLALVASLVWFLASGGAMAQSEQRADDPEVQLLEQNVELFLEQIDGNVREALQDLLKGSPLSSQTEAINSLDQKARGITSQYGAILDFERASSRKIGKRVVLVRYLLNCENCPLVWYVTYYHTQKRGETSRSGENWVVVSLRFDTNVELLALEK
jgi:hypothetical protein